MQCCVGKYFHEPCESETEPQSIKKKFCEEDENILKLRVNEKISTICKRHETKYLYNYSQYFGKKCCDPFGTHSSVVTKCLRKITLNLAQDVKFLKLIPGTSLCARCRDKISSKNKELKNDLENRKDPLFEPINNIYSEEALLPLGISPAKIKKLNYDQREKAIGKSISKSANTIRNELNKSFNLQLSNPTSEVLLWAEGYKSLVEDLKIKFKKCEKMGEKIKIFTLVPTFWTVENVCHEFNATKYEVKMARELLKKEGLLPELTRINNETE